MLEHRKKERRKTESVDDNISISFPSSERSASPSIRKKYSTIVPSTSRGIDHVLDYSASNSSETNMCPSPVRNQFVIDSEEEYSDKGDEETCGYRINCSQNSFVRIKQNSSTGSKKYRCRRVLPAKGTEEKTNILKIDARRRTQESAGRYSCPFCDYCAPFPSKVKRHIVNKHSDSHLCSDCNKRFDTFLLLRKHCSTEHPKLHRCQFCDFSNKTQAAVRRHTVANHENGVMCTVAGCSMRVARWRLKKHLMKYHPCSPSEVASRNMHLERLPEIERGPSLKCLDCTFVTNDLEDYNLHVVRAHKEGFECPFPDCSVRFLLGDMDDHFAAMHEPSKQENGSFCLQFRDNSAASATTTTVSECASTSYCSDALCSDFEMPTPSRMPVGVFQGSSRDFQCSLCGKNYQDFYLLRKHVRSVHERRYTQRSRPLKYTCDWPDCARAFASPGLLQDHVNAHRGVRPYQCTNCGCSFSARARFAVHLSKYHRMSIRDYNCASDLLKPPSNDESQI
ncbi:hypothetical protein RB195_018137 [Necator americanus]